MTERQDIDRRIKHHDEGLRDAVQALRVLLDQIHEMAISVTDVPGPDHVAALDKIAEMTKPNA